MARAGLVENFVNHTFQPRTIVRRADLAQSIARDAEPVAVSGPSTARQGWRCGPDSLTCPQSPAYGAISPAVVGAMTAGWTAPSGNAAGHRATRSPPSNASARRPLPESQFRTTDDRNMLTAANQITLLRMLLMRRSSSWSCMASLGGRSRSSWRAGLTDMLDGLIARWSGQRARSVPGSTRWPTSSSRSAPHRAHHPRPRPREPVTDLADGDDHFARRRQFVMTVAIINLAVGASNVSGRPSLARWRRPPTCLRWSWRCSQLSRYHSVMVDLFIWASMAITLISSLHYISNAARIIDSTAA